MYNDLAVPSGLGALDNVVGKPVTGKDFFGRARELDELASSVGQQHVLMLAPRRVGKTSLMLALEARERQRGEVTPVYASVASATSEADFARLILTAIYATPQGASLRPGRFESWRQQRRLQVKKLQVPGVSLELDGSEPPWQQVAEAALHKLAHTPKPWLLLIDELPNLVLALAEQDESGARVRAFLGWFRAVRQNPLWSQRVRFLLAGSIGLDAVTHRFRATATINDLLDWRLGPFDRETAQRFVGELAHGLGMQLVPEVHARLLDETEWLIPYHLQVVVAELAKKKRSLVPQLEDVTLAIEGALAHRIYFATWDERLHEVFGRADATLARKVLTACAQDPQGARVDTLRGVLARSRTADGGDVREHEQWILDVLESDGYLVEVSAQRGSRWRFRSALLRRYWLQRVS